MFSLPRFTSASSPCSPLGPDTKGDYTTDLCTVDQHTVEGWTMDAIPTDVSGDDECAFYQFVWHEMLQLVQQKDGLPLFATWPNDAALFPATGPPEPWQTRSDWPMTLRQTRKVTPFLADHIDQAATHSPLVDQ